MGRTPRRWWLMLSIVAPLSLTACRKDEAAAAAPETSSTPPAPTAPPAPSATPPPVAVDAGVPLPLAKGDPCRGLPLPADKHYVPTGLCARAIASGVPNVRQLTFAPNGDLFAGSWNGTVKLMHDADGSGTFESSEIHDFAETGGYASNCHIANGFLYAGSPDGVMRWPYVAGAKSGGTGEPVIVGQPSTGHPLHTVHVYDGYLYVHSGSLLDASDPASPEYDRDRSLLRRFLLSSFVPGAPFAWLSGEVVTVGLRNMVGFTKNAAGRMYGVVNGFDAITHDSVPQSQDNPGEQVVELGMGRKFGFPFCFTAQRIQALDGGGFIPPGTQVRYQPNAVHDDAWCAANSMKPTTFLQAHSAPLDILFFDGQPKGVLPERWRGGAFVTLHGSYYRAAATGYKVVWLPFDAQGQSIMPKLAPDGGIEFPYETVFGGGSLAAGAIDGQWTWNVLSDGESPRPVGVAISPIDGALYISSDAGHLYRIGLKGSGK